MSWRLTKRGRFEAAHVLPHHDGKCARLHGHSFEVEIEIAGGLLHDQGPKSGMLMDFADLDRPLDRLIEQRLDHWYLNESTGLGDPTSEELARWIYNQLKPDLLELVAVTVEETCTSRARYEPT